VQQLQANQFEKLIIHLFKRGTSAFIMILGRRETGKTDLSLLIAEIVYHFGIIKNIATNIKIYESEIPIDRVTNLQDLDLWARDHQGKKLYILDEIGKSVRRRTPMARLNISVIDRLQVLRKHKLSIIGIAPDQKYVDSSTLGSDMLDATFIKYNFENPKIALFVDYLENQETEIRNLPRTGIHFDTWDSAPFTERNLEQVPKFKDENLQLLWKYSHGTLEKDLPINRRDLAKLKRKFIKETLERQCFNVTPLEREAKAQQETERSE
jgi:hypothetical protein